MSHGGVFNISKYKFNDQAILKSRSLSYVKDFWPLIYILSSRKLRKAYVGETTDAFTRLTTHQKNDLKKMLENAWLISSDKFNKSATLDIESNLIKYLSGDGGYKLLNANIGLSEHSFYQKSELYWDIFEKIWERLRHDHFVKNTLERVSNSDLFKYSPYKSLSKDQKAGIVSIMHALIDRQNNNIVVEGTAGTGKTVLATFLFKLLKTDLDGLSFNEYGSEEEKFIALAKELKSRYPNPSMALVIPMSTFRGTIKQVFSNVEGLSRSMVIGPAELKDKKYDILIVDEAHRLRRRVGLGKYFKTFDAVCKALGFDKDQDSELDWILKQGEKRLLFYDEKQSIRPSDIRQEHFIRLKSSSATINLKLKSQFRVRGGPDYVAFIDKLLDCQFKKAEPVFKLSGYEFLLYESIEAMVKDIQRKDKEVGLSRLIAGYSWEWVSKKKRNAKDIVIENVSLRWNSPVPCWINSENAHEEVGCIHTTQGYDLNYAAVIFGNEISYDKEKNKIIIREENYKDRNGKGSIKNLQELQNYIINIYKTLMLRGIRGTYVYVCDQELRAYFRKHIPLSEPVQQKHVTVSIPLYDVRAAAGNFSDPQNSIEHEMIEVPDRFKKSQDYFACRIQGDSMDKKIPNGSICIFRKDFGGSREGRIVLVQHHSIQDPDFGAGYTVKEYHSTKEIGEEGWSHKEIALRPKSNKRGFKEIILHQDELNSLKVIGIFVEVIKKYEKQ